MREAVAVKIAEHLAKIAAPARVKRALDKLQDRLGGEAPIWRGRRRIRSNAQARVEIRNQEERGD